MRYESPFNGSISGSLGVCQKLQIINITVIHGTDDKSILATFRSKNPVTRDRNEMQSYVCGTL